MKKVQIDYELFRKLIFYHLGSDDQYEEDIRNGLEEKLDALVRHELYPEEWLPEAGTLESAKSYRKRIFPLLKKVANMIQSLYSKYLELKDRNRKLSDRNMDLENRVDRLRDEVSIIKKENLALLNVAYDLERARNMLGKSKVDDAIAMAKRLEQVNAKQKANKKHIDRDVR